VSFPPPSPAGDGVVHDTPPFDDDGHSALHCQRAVRLRLTARCHCRALVATFKQDALLPLFLCEQKQAIMLSYFRPLVTFLCLQSLVFGRRIVEKWSALVVRCSVACPCARPARGSAPGRLPRTSRVGLFLPTETDQAFT